MPKGTRICKVCGKEYEYCHTNRRVPGVFRWQDVSCSPEHGSIYLAEILASREKTESSSETEAVTSVATEVPTSTADESITEATTTTTKKRSRRRKVATE